MFRVFKKELPENAIICKSRLLWWKLVLLQFYIYKHFRFSILSRWVRCLIRLNFLVPVRIYCFKSWNRRSKSGFNPFSENSWIRWEKYGFSLQLYTRMHGFKDAFLKTFWRGLTQRLRRLLSSLNLWLRLRFGFRPQFSGACAIDRLNRFGFRPQFTPPTCLLTPPPTEGD